MNYEYRQLKALAETVPVGDWVEVYYFALKTTPGLFKIKEIRKCRIKIDDKMSYRKHLAYNYQTATGNWSSILEYSSKHNTYYYITLKEAEQAFKQQVEIAKEHFTNLINSANIALSELDKY